MNIEQRIILKSNNFMTEVIKLYKTVIKIKSWYC